MLNLIPSSMPKAKGQLPALCPDGQKITRTHKVTWRGDGCGDQNTLRDKKKVRRTVATEAREKKSPVTLC